MSIDRFRSVVPVLSFAFLPLVGCGEITKVQECNKVIEAVNASNVGEVKGDDKKAWEEESTRALDLEKKLGEIKLSDEGLKKHTEEYREMLKNYSDLAKKTGSAGEGDMNAVLEITKKANDIISKSNELTAKINTYCTGSAQ